MTRWLLALPGALAVTVLLAFALGWMVGREGRDPVPNAHLPAPGSQADANGQAPRRPEIPVRHVYPVPVWDPGPAAPDPAPGLPADIVATAAPGLEGVVRTRTSCTVRVRADAVGTVGVEPVACPDPDQLATISALIETGYVQSPGALRLVIMTGQFDSSSGNED